MTDPFRSARLIYRAVDTKDDLAFFISQALDSEAQMNVNPNLVRPQGREAQEDWLNRQKDMFLSVVICLPAPASSAPASSIAAAVTSKTDASDILKPVPIGTMSMRAPPGTMSHHRHAMVGLQINSEYRGQGYGQEALEWCLEWAFRRAALHKVSLGYFGWNPRAGKLYEKIGFVKEGVLRENFWHDGQWWDEIEMGMLESEWRALREKKQECVLEVLLPCN